MMERNKRYPTNDGQHLLSNETDERIEQVARCELPKSVANLLVEYEEAIGERDAFIWKWLYQLFPEIRLSTVAPEYERAVRDAKLLASMFVVILDDLAEIQMDRVTFEECSKIPVDYQSANFERDGVDVAHLEFASRVWDALEETLATAPRYEEFLDLFGYDLRQNVNAIDYSYTVNQHLEMGNVVETELYDAHNMMLFTYANVDLMFSPSFDPAELAEMRRVVFTAQEMARIGNWITTWEREIGEGDYSSGVVIYALEHGIVSPGELYRARANPSAHERIVDAIREQDVEGLFFGKWRRKRAAIAELASNVTCVNVDSYVEGMETVMSYHLASRGLK